MARAGTSLLLRTMQRHASFLHDERLRLESNAVALLYDLVDPSATVPSELLRFLEVEALPDDITHTLSRMRQRRSIVRRLAEGRRSPWSSPRVWRLGGEHLVVRSFFDATAALRGVRVVEKTPAHLYRTLHLRMAYPGARFVSLVRHPVDVLSAYRRRYAREGELSSWSDVTVEEMAEIWSRAARSSLHYAGMFTDAFTIVRYEDLVADPVRTIQRVLVHVDEPFDARALDDFEESATVQPGGREPATWATRWSENVDPDDARRLEYLVGGSMTAFGSERYVTG
jgi:hypothetical protein